MNTATGDPGFDVCCATVVFYNGTSSTSVKQCFPQYLAMDSNGKRVNISSTYGYAATCTANVTSTSTSCTTESGCSTGNCCATRGWTIGGSTYNATTMVCRNSSLYLTENQFYTYNSS